MVIGAEPQPPHMRFSSPGKALFMALLDGYLGGARMPGKPVFAGLIVDEDDRPVETTYLGGEPFYVIDDQGFKR